MAAENHCKVQKANSSNPKSQKQFKSTPIDMIFETKIHQIMCRLLQPKMPKKIETLTPILENRRTQGERGNLGKHQICGARVKDLLWVTLALITHVLAPKSLKKSASNCCQI